MNDYNYECPKCHNVFPLANKLMHDIRCTESNPVPLNASRMVGKSDNINDDNKNKEPIQHRPQPQNFISKRRPDSHIKPLDVKESIIEVPKTFNCWLCGRTLPEKEKSDHMLCHQLEEENEKNQKKKLEDQKKNFPQNQRPQRPLQSHDSSQGIPQRLQQPHGIQQQRPQQPHGIQQQRPHQPHGPQQQRPSHGPQQRPHGPQQNNSNLKRSFVPFEDINIFDFNQIHESINKMNNPTDEDILNQLPETEIGDVSTLDPEIRNCIICLVDLKSGDKATMLPCIHMFHSFCVQEWLKTNNFCPVCKYKLTIENINNL